MMERRWKKAKRRAWTFKEGIVTEKMVVEKPASKGMSWSMPIAEEGIVHISKHVLKDTIEEGERIRKRIEVLRTPARPRA